MRATGARPSRDRLPGRTADAGPGIHHIDDDTSKIMLRPDHAPEGLTGTAPVASGVPVALGGCRRWMSSVRLRIG
ncbi:hypothetical protein [Streptomyces sp. NPDC018055]|uniref:hypothetical protein n=1 Tax=Streptomyces sp. NPDC018055 TaxID=3365038 RepID=UPI0037A5D551